MAQSRLGVTAALIITGAMGCGGGGGGGGECTAITGTNHAKFVTNTLTLPATNMDFQFDPNGSGPKNQLGNLIAILSQKLNPQKSTDTAIASGDLILLMDQTSTD